MSFFEIAMADRQRRLEMQRHDRMMEGIVRHVGAPVEVFRMSCGPELYEVQVNGGHLANDNNHRLTFCVEGWKVPGDKLYEHIAREARERWLEHNPPPWIPDNIVLGEE